MFFYTVVCSERKCVWQFGPTTKKRAKQAMAMHKQIHSLEAELKYVANLPSGEGDDG